MLFLQILFGSLTAFVFADIESRKKGRASSGEAESKQVAFAETAEHSADDAVEERRAGIKEPVDVRKDNRRVSDEYETETEIASQTESGAESATSDQEDTVSESEETEQESRPVSKEPGNRGRTGDETDEKGKQSAQRPTEEKARDMTTGEPIVSDERPHKAAEADNNESSKTIVTTSNETNGVRKNTAEHHSEPTVASVPTAATTPTAETDSTSETVTRRKASDTKQNQVDYKELALRYYQIGKDALKSGCDMASHYGYIYGKKGLHAGKLYGQKAAVKVEEFARYCYAKSIQAKNYAIRKYGEYREPKKSRQEL